MHLKFPLGRVAIATAFLLLLSALALNAHAPALSYTNNTINIVAGGNNNTYG
jgi:hypothetical protein